MRELEFSIAGAHAVAHAAAPMLALEVAIANRGGAIHSAMLACQIAIEPAARAYGEADRARLVELFGAGTPPRSLLWTHATLAVPGFADATRVELVLPCPIDFVHAAAKYFDGVRDGVVPIVVQLSGTVFYDAGGRMQVAPIGRDREARFALPVALWRETIAHYFPDCAPLALRRDVFDQLHAFRRARGIATADDAIATLLGEQRS